MIRVRFAPSPTGHLHIGGLRSALFNWLFARHAGGKFLLRIEDTDLERSRPEFTDSILGAFSWCALEPDEPMVIQSTRRHEHLEVAMRLIENGHAYRCYCTVEELRRRLSQEYAHYDGRCRDRTDTPDLPFVIRFKMPKDRSHCVVDDLIHGKVTFPLDTIDDFIIVRSDGTPMYNFVVVVDDAFMRITHIIRGEEHLINTPRQMLLYEACGYTMPQFAHIPLILGPDGTKLSKRDAAVSVLDYKQAGFLPDALCNYLVRLGWSHGDKEIFSRQEMIDLFSLETVGKTGAIFDTVKLQWVNTVYMKHMSGRELLEYSEKNLDHAIQSELKNWTGEQICHFIDMYKDRVKTLVELRTELIRIHSFALYAGQPFIHELRAEQWQALDLLKSYLSESEYTRDNLQLIVKRVCKEAGVQLPDLAQPLRFALTGSLSAPGIYDLLSAFGKQGSVDRLQMLCAARPK